MNLLNYLESLIPVSVPLKQELSGMTERILVKKNQHILEIGERCRDLRGAMPNA